jgi:RND family efflux transporter MFP subunit
MPHNDTGTQPRPLACPARKGAIKWFLTIPIVLLLFGALALVLRTRESHVLAAGTNENVAEPVSVTHPEEHVATGDISLPSTLQAFDDSTIYARTSGYVQSWSVDIGAQVHQGQLLALIQSPEIDQELDQARAMQSQTQANLTLAQVTAKRYQELSGTKAVAQQDVDMNNQNLSAQVANLQAADANVKRLQELQGFERVLAPFDGVVTQRLVNVGDLINAGNGGNGAQLFHISKVRTMRVFVPVPELFANQIVPGLKADLSLTELPGQSFEGFVVRTSHAIDPGSHTLLTEIDVPNPSGKLMPGAYANVHLHLAQPAKELVIPTGAVLFQAAGPQVVIVNAQNKLERRKVSIGNDLGNQIEITSGLSPSDRIVSSPPDYVVDGMAASIQTQPSTGPNSAGSDANSTDSGK